MRKQVTKVLAFSLAFALSASLLSACGSKKPESSPSQATAATQAASTQNEAVYPLKGNPSVKYWMLMHANWSGFAKNFGETDFAKELEKRTGVKVEYVHPPLGQDKEVFNIMVASGDYPDIIEYKWTDFPGGPSAAINNGVIIKLNDAINKYSPNLKKFLEANPGFNKDAKMDDGSYYFYPFLRNGKELLNTSGPIIRKDWLDELGLKVPETMDEWYTMLKAFKEKKNATAAFTAIGDKNGIQTRFVFEGAYNTKGDFYIQDGKVKFGYMDPSYKDMLTYLNKLYTEGLLDKNFGSTDTKARDSNMLNGKSGATYGAGGGQMGAWLTTMKDKDPKYNLAASKFPVLKKGDKITVGNTSGVMDRNYQVAISTKAKNVEATARLLDYAYSKEGKLFYNFGTEGVSYTMKNGVPTYTDLVMKNPKGMTVAQAFSNNARGNMNGPFEQDPQYILQYYETDQQKDALKQWSEHDKLATLIPMITHTDAESSEIAKIMNDANTYVQEMQLKFIMGTEPLSNFDKYVDQLKKMNIEKAITIKQTAMDRYNKR